MPADAIAVDRGAAGVAGDQNDLLAGSKNARPFGDIDNRLKDILDALQGFFHGGKGWKQKRPKPIITNDSQIYQVVAEKVDPPLANVHRGSGGGLLKIRRLSPAHRKRLHRWDSLWK